MTDAPKPKNCPCCGAEMKKAHWGYYHSLDTHEFAACLLRDIPLKSEADISAWNRRVADDELSERTQEQWDRIFDELNWKSLANMERLIRGDEPYSVLKSSFAKKGILEKKQHEKVTLSGRRRKVVEWHFSESTRAAYLSWKARREQ